MKRLTEVWEDQYSMKKKYNGEMIYIYTFAGLKTTLSVFTELAHSDKESVDNQWRGEVESDSDRIMQDLR